jgi:hypothetical protein
VSAGSVNPGMHSKPLKFALPHGQLLNNGMGPINYEKQTVKENKFPVNMELACNIIA